MLLLRHPNIWSHKGLVRWGAAGAQTYPTPSPWKVRGGGSLLPRAARRAKCGVSSSFTLTGDPEYLSSDLILMRRLLIVCVVSTALPLTLAVAFRTLVPESSALDFVLWNLALAWVPLVAALALDNVPFQFARAAAPLLGLWLAFLPNAPY